MHEFAWIFLSPLVCRFFFFLGHKLWLNFCFYCYPVKAFSQSPTLIFFPSLFLILVNSFFQTFLSPCSLASQSVDNCFEVGFCCYCCCFFKFCFLRYFSSPSKLLCLDITCKHLLLTVFRGLLLLHPKYISHGLLF